MTEFIKRTGVMKKQTLLLVLIVLANVAVVLFFEYRCTQNKQHDDAPQFSKVDVKYNDEALFDNDDGIDEDYDDDKKKNSYYPLIEEVPKDLTWTKVSPDEIKQTGQCLFRSLEHCCIGQCRQEELFIKPGTDQYNQLFVKPAPSLTDMSGLLRVLHETKEKLNPIPNWCSLVFVGDSLSHDHQVAAVCQLTQMGYKIFYCNSHAGAKVYGNDTTFCKESFPPNNNTKEDHVFEMVSSSSKFCSQIRIVWRDFRAWSELLSLETDEAGVIVFNWAVHCKDETSMEHFMSENFLPYVNKYPELPQQQQRYFLMWREHEPQHFDSPDGLYEHRSKSGACWGNITQFDNFRNEVAERFIQNHTEISSRVHIIRMFDALTPLHMFHHRHDCTHYCYSPWRFDVTWHGIARGLQILSNPLANN
jgi:hypothetical protein